MAKPSRKIAGSDNNSVAEESRRALLATIGDPSFENGIIWENTFADHSFNVREEKSYEFEENKELYNSLLNFGLEKRGDMMAFSVQPDGRYKVIVGHLRHAMMGLIRTHLTNQREAIVKAGETPVDDPIPFGTIFGLVYRDLSEDQEGVLMADHAMRKALNAYEMCVMVGKSYYARGLTMAQAASYYGMTPNKCQRSIHRYDMPTVLEEYRKESTKGLDVPYVKVGEEQVSTLHQAQQHDKSAMGSAWRPRMEGANFRAAWKLIVNDPDSAGKRSVANKEKQTRSQEDLKKQAESIRAAYGFGEESDAVADILKWAGNVKDEAGNVPNFQAAMDVLKSTIDGLREENNKLRSEIESLRTALHESADAIGQVSKDLESERENVSILDDECVALRAEVQALRNPEPIPAENV